LNFRWDKFRVTKENRFESEALRSVRVRQRALGRELRRIFEDIVREPVPDELLDLLQKIDEADNRKKLN
jgi:hypothetical protein